MIKTEIVKGKMPFRITIDEMHGMGNTPAGATMAALSVGGKIPAGTRDRKKAARYIFWKYEASATWLKLIHILEHSTFEEEKAEGSKS